MIQRLSKKMSAYFDGEPSNDYDVIMNMVRDSLVESGLEPAILKPDIFSIVPYFAWAKPIEAGTVTTFDNHV